MTGPGGMRNPTRHFVLISSVLVLLLNARCTLGAANPALSTLAKDLARQLATLWLL